jgi:hypothetical protein
MDQFWPCTIRHQISDGLHKEVTCCSTIMAPQMPVQSTPGATSIIISEPPPSPMTCNNCLKVHNATTSCEAKTIQQTINMSNIFIAVKDHTHRQLQSAGIIGPVMPVTTPLLPKQEKSEGESQLSTAYAA